MACNRSTRPSSTAASPGDSRRRATRSTSTASCAARRAMASTARRNSGRSEPIWRRWRRSSTSPGAASPRISSKSDQAWLLSEAAFRLRALGRLTEALQPMRAGLEMRVQQEDWKRRGDRCRQPQRVGGHAGPLDGRRRRCPPVDHPRRPERRCVPANGQPHHGGGCPASVRPARRSRRALRRSRTDAEGNAAAVRPALFAARLPVLRLAPGPRRTRRVAGPPRRHGHPVRGG